MSPTNRLIQRIKALFPRVPQSVPDPRSRTGAQATEARVIAGYSYSPGTVFPLGDSPPPAADYSSPLTVAGTAIGEIQTGTGETDFTEAEKRLIDAVAARLAGHLENLSRPD